MFYHIFDYLEQFDFPGAGMFQYITFRSACAVILSLLIATVVGKRIIRILQKQQVGEEIRDLGLEGQMQKKGTLQFAILVQHASQFIAGLIALAALPEAHRPFREH